jgi:hypothetical protein
MTAWSTSPCGLRESDANVRVYNDARGGDGASDLRARGAWCPGDDGLAADSELTEWTEPRSDAADAVDAADDADAERGTRLEYGVPCGSVPHCVLRRPALASTDFMAENAESVIFMSQFASTSRFSGLRSRCATPLL